MNRLPIALVLWDDPRLDPEVWDPADGLPRSRPCPKATVGFVVEEDDDTIWLAHEVYLDGSGAEWVSTSIPKRVIAERYTY